MTNAKRFGQFMTPDWAALELVDKYFGNLRSTDQVIEPSCGTGAFLRALPDFVPAIGVEIDPELAEVAKRTGRKVIVGDFRMVDLPLRATAIVGNPPFQKKLIDAFLDRAWHLLEDEGRVGFILPSFTFQTASTIAKLNEHWSIRQDMLPRNLFGRLNYPVCFAVLTKGTTRGLVGFALYHEVVAVNRLQARYKALLEQGERSVWAAVVRAALEALGGKSDLSALYREIEGHRPTTNKFWREKVRQQLQLIAVRVAEGIWALPAEAAA